MGNRRHLIQEIHKIKNALFHFIDHFLAVKIGKKILVGQVFSDTVAYKNIFPSIVIKIKTQGSPAPARGINAGKLCDLAECSIMII